MKGYHNASYGDRWADLFNGLPDDANGVRECAQFLAKLADGGMALELGVGTGRIAFALADQGIRVHGIDTSLQMLQVLTRHRGGRQVDAWCADMANFGIRQRYNLVYIIANAFFMLQSAADQQACFQSASDALLPSGTLVVQTTIPDLASFTHNQLIRIESMQVDQADLLIGWHEPDQHVVSYQRVQLTENGIRLRPLVYRYVYPDEQDNMASHAGLAVAATLSDWNGAPYLSNIRQRIACYKKVAYL